MTPKEFFDILDKYEKGLCSGKEIEIIDKFYQLLNKEESRWKGWDSSTRECIRIEILHKIHHKINVKPRSGKLIIPVYLKYAASVLIIIGLGLLYQFQFYETRNITSTTGKGENLTVNLSDGSEVQLNAESSLTYPRKFKGRKRLVSFSGEAFFKVSKDLEHPFVIHSGDISTTVLGTSFNIQAYPSDTIIRVCVATGKVLVKKTSNDSESDLESIQTVLLPNELAHYRKSTKSIEKKGVDIHRFTAWRDGLIILDKISMVEASKILERWYDVNFHFGDSTAGKIIINGEFRNDTIINILENIKFLTGIDYELEANNQILITKNEKQKNESKP